MSPSMRYARPLRAGARALRSRTCDCRHGRLDVLLPVVRHDHAATATSRTGRRAATRRRTTSRRTTTRRSACTRRAARRCSTRRWLDVARAGINELAVSWWGRGSAEDQRLPARDRGRRAARDRGRRAPRAVPRPHRREHARRHRRTSTGSASRTFYLYRPFDLPAADWAPMNDQLRAQGVEVFAQTALVGAAATGHFTGVYTYDTLVYGGGLFARLCKQAHARGLLCAPSVGPGYDAQRATGDTRVKPRRNGLTYDSMWRAAIRGRRRPDHDHVVQRVAGGDADRARRVSPAPQRRLRLRLLRRRLGAARRDCRNGISRPDGLVGAAVQAADAPRASRADARRWGGAEQPVSFGRGRPHRLRAARAASERADDRAARR